jgi:DNA invertase Pin-like site-specific DNA recombinase
MNTSLELPVDEQLGPGQTDATPKNVYANSLSLSLGANKIQPQHHERLAVVYVRQSSPQQVLNHRESRELQYKLADRAVELGWNRERVVVIDDDQAQTASTMEGRFGFQHLLAEVSLNHVGLVLGMEMARLARCNKDWHQLLEVCALFDTLLYDHDGLYDASHYNDRLVLGLKGTMSEAELHILNTRMQQGRRNKAGRGELFSTLPCGYVQLPSGEVSKDPDEQARSVVDLVFRKFEQLQSGHALLRYLVSEDIRLPFRGRSRTDREQLQWRRPNLAKLMDMLHHPAYAGAYVHGRRPVDPKRKKPGTRNSGQRLVPMEQWEFLIRDRLPAYISWEQYLKNQQRIAENNTQKSPGPPREGISLLSGLIVCGRCGYHMQVRYHGPKPYYYCLGGYAHEGTRTTCQLIGGPGLDNTLAEQAMKVLQPASLELSLRAADNVEQERRALHQHWQQRLERAAYDVDRARRQYDAVEPENRLVARELERQWEAALIEQRTLGEEYRRFQSERPDRLSADQRTAIMSLACDIPALWQAASTSNADRQRLIRHLVDRVVVEVQGESEIVDCAIHWKGGYQSQHEVIRPVKKYEQLRDYVRLKGRITELRKQGWTIADIAKQLNKEGLRTPRGGRHNVDSVRQFIFRFEQNTRLPDLPADEWWIHNLAREISVPWSTLNGWRTRGWLTVRKTKGVRKLCWIAWADAEELARLRRLRDYESGNKPYPTELTTPKLRSENGRQHC